MTISETAMRTVGANMAFAATAETWEAGLAILRSEGANSVATVFQSERWLRIWGATIGVAAGRPFMVAVREAATGVLVALLALVLRKTEGLRIVEWADCGVSDYNAPILAIAAPTDAAGARALWKAVQHALPSADLVRLTKMPPSVAGRPNPLALLRQSCRCGVSANTLIIRSSWPAYLKTLERRFRKELGRSWRVFAKHQGAAFRLIESSIEVRDTMAALERQQRERFGPRGGYVLDRAEMSSFYRILAGSGDRDGSVLLSALVCGNEIVAVLLGLARSPYYVMIRLSADSARWGHCSPGRLLIVETLRFLHGQGFSEFDFSIGDYAYKRRLGVQSGQLFSFSSALSPLGWPAAVHDRAKGTIRRVPALERFAHGLLKAAQTAARRVATDKRAAQDPR